MGNGVEPGERLSTGIEGLDHILRGGFFPRRAYLVNGPPGSGKTTLGLHFLTAARDGERSLLITLTEPVESVAANARAAGFDLSRVAFLDLTPTAEFFAEAQTYDIFLPADVERLPITQRIVDEVSAVKPTRVLIDSLTSFRYLASNPYEFRRQALSLLRFLADHGATVLFTSEASADAPDEDLQFIADGIVTLGYDCARGRFLTVTKFRGSSFERGRHSVTLSDSGMRVFPRVHPEGRARPLVVEQLSTGVRELDLILGGGIERGTVTLVTGPSGVGKTTFALQFAAAAAARGERVAYFSFEEEPDLMLARARGVRIPLDEAVAAGTFALEKVEPLAYSAEEFFAIVRREVEELGARVVAIDSTAGYKLALRGERLEEELHALSKYLEAHDVAVILVTEVHDVTGDFKPTEERVSFIGDNIVFIRYLELEGQLRKAIGVLKKRLSDFERTLREFEITSEGIRVGEPLSRLRGILRGVPEWKEPA